MSCKYKYSDGKKCEEEVMPNSDYCVLHSAVPSNESSENFANILRLKKNLIISKLDIGDYNFEGAHIYKLNLPAQNIEGDMNFNNSIITKYVRFNESHINGNVFFNGSKILGKIMPDDDESDNHHGTALSFMGTTIGGNISMNDAEICGNIAFICIIGKFLYINKTNVDGSIWFCGTEVGGYPSFRNSELQGDIILKDAKLGTDTKLIESIKSYGYNVFDDIKIKGVLDIIDVKFGDLLTQEKACRKAKLIHELVGNKEEADNHYFHEMEAKRRQKKTVSRYFELFLVQFAFGYGVRPLRVVGIYFFVIIIFAFVFLFGDGAKIEFGIDKANSMSGYMFLLAEDIRLIIDYLFISLFNSTNMGYNDYQPTGYILKYLANIEKIIGSFIWAAFIVIFARKYMR